MKAKYYEGDDLLWLTDGASGKDGSTLPDEALVGVEFPDAESREITGLEVISASHYFTSGYNPDADIWTLGNVKGADLIEEHGDFVGYWQEYRFDDGDIELSLIGVELRKASKHIPSSVRKALRRKHREHKDAVVH